MSKCDRHNRNRIVKQEKDYLHREVAPRVKAGDFHRLQQADNGVLCLGGPCSPTEWYLHVRTDRGPVTFVMNNDDLCTLQEQLLDLCIWAEQISIENERLQPARSEAMH